MFKKIATATVLTAGMLVMGSSAFAFTYTGQVSGDDYQALHYTAKHGNCSIQDNTRVCTNFNSSN